MMYPGMPMMSDAMGAMTWWGVAWMVGAAALVALVVLVAIRDRPRGDDRGAAAKRILDVRLAKGEIDAQEYRDRRALLG